MQIKPGGHDETKQNNITTMSVTARLTFFLSKTLSFVKHLHLQNMR